jgi:hypothetical protein
MAGRVVVSDTSRKLLSQLDVAKQAQSHYENEQRAKFQAVKQGMDYDGFCNLVKTCDLRPLQVACPKPDRSAFLVPLLGAFFL